MTCALLGVAGGTVLLGLRIFITAMQPGTNLYSSFLFVGWGAALLALIATRRMPDGYGEMLAGAAGFLSLWVSMAFAPSSDSMAPVVAVLNSKFWLLTHVLTIALGYSGCLIAGVAAHVYLVLVARGRTDEAVSRLRAFLYGTLRFGLLFAFIGTVTGGIWADRTWGRFWGWDPKENGALLIVLWCSALLHARPNRLIDDHAFAAGCIVGNAIVAVAWLGVNLLGVGLHSYGFTSGLARGLLLFCGFELALAGALWFAAGRQRVSSSRFQVSS
jgi:ABC-type transport system involved in cytochrome c biogenesis permease subunit